jgi:hypothetical protein
LRFDRAAIDFRKSITDPHRNRAMTETTTPAPTQDDFLVERIVPGFQPPPRPQTSPDGETLGQAERAARAWTSPLANWPATGSSAQAEALRDMFRDTFNPYRPAVIEWPNLTPEERERITSLPIWDIAVQTEGRARMYMACYAALIDDPAMREAVALNAWEENRHKDVLSRMVQAYDIPLIEEPPYPIPADPEWSYLVTGYSECVDSFFAFGLFKLASGSGMFPPELVETFEPVMQEECRHILLFANWLAWRRARLGLLDRIRFEFRVMRVWIFLGAERVGLARSMDGDKTKDDSNFAVSGAQSVTSEPFELRDLIELCLSENERRFAGYDQRLLRPETMPRLAGFALKFLRKKK